MVGGLSPLLISRFTSQIGITVLYAHPHISEGNLDRFIDDVQKPCSNLSLDTKVSLVHHLTVRPTPMQPKDEKVSGYREEKRLVDPSLPKLTRLFPILRSFVLRDCLIHTGQDAITVFSSLPRMKPEKARLEIRMWPLTDTEVGRDLALATNFSTHGFVRPNATRSSLDHSYSIQGQWRDAVYGDKDMALPRAWLDPEEVGRANEAARARRQLMVPPFVVAAPFDFVDPNLPEGARLQIPVAGMDPLGRAIELCRDVFRTDFARTSVPNEALIRRELIRIGPFRPQMTRQHAAIVLQRLGHRRPINAPDAVDLDVVKKANLWADAARVQATNEAERIRQLARGSNTTQSQQAHEAREDHMKALRSRLRLGNPTNGSMGSSVASSDAAPPPVPSGAWFPPTDDSSAISRMYDDSYGSRNFPIDLGDSEDDDSDVEANDALLREALRRSRNQAEMPTQPGEASSSSRTRSLSSIEPQGTTSKAGLRLYSRGETSIANLPSTDGQLPRQAESALPSIDATPASLIKATATTSTDPPDSLDDLSAEDLSDFLAAAADVSLPATTPLAADSTSAASAGPSVPGLLDSGDPQAPQSWRVVRLDDETWSQAVGQDPHLAEYPELAGATEQESSATYSVMNSIGPAGSSAPVPTIVEELAIVDTTRDSPARLAAAIRRQMLHLIENSWSPTLLAFSLVTLDPLASLIAQSPHLDLWVNIAVPHIRVQLPRGINPLAIFKGSVENARDRDRPIMLARRRAAEGIANSNNEAITHSSALRDQYPPTEPHESIVGGDGSGGGLVHPDNRLFEVEVNTVREMSDEMWAQAGSELPPQVCRILTGIQDWSEVGTRASVFRAC
jgi:hypothetical protein